MAQLIVRDLEDEVKEKLSLRAKAHGRSMEAEVREILRNAVVERVPARRLGSLIASRFEGIGLDRDTVEELRGWSARRLDVDT